MLVQQLIAQHRSHELSGGQIREDKNAHRILCKRKGDVQLADF